VNRHCINRSFIGIALASGLVLPTARADSFGLETLELQYAEQGWGEPRANKSVDDHPLFIDGKRFEHGFGTHANSILRIGLSGKG
jgi:alpha-galactosidase